MDRVEEFDRTMTYREALLNTASDLNFLIYNLLSRIFEMTMTGELKEWSDSVPNGETHLIGIDLYKSIDDINVSSLVELFGVIENRYESFLNINAINLAEIDKYRDKKFNNMHSFTDEGDEDDEDDDTSVDGLPF